jgi:hypothetical protein
MQPIKRMAQILDELSDRDHYLFSLSDLHSILPYHNLKAFRALLARLTKSGVLLRVCRNLYLYPRADYESGLVLYHAAARLRDNEFNYLSLESVLSDAGVISQIPMNWITIMSSGRSYIFDCGIYGHIEFIHTKKSIDSVVSQIVYDQRICLWRASVSLAFKDMVLTKRSCDLVDQEAVSELV